jgi:exopolysaccharide production protein ExoQ
MPPMIAAVLCIFAVGYCFWRDTKENPHASAALWIPLVWMFLAGSRYVSSWLNLGSGGGAADYDDGSPLDAAVFAVLIVAGLVVLARRGEQWSQIVWRNKLVACYLLYCLVSVVWSDQPSIGVRRWVKDMGNPIMALVILSEPKPSQALGIVLRRLAYLVLPLSVLFVRYYPELGRTYHFGVPTFTGVGHQKNALGQMCLVTGLYVAWQVLADRETFKTWATGRRLRLWLLVAMVAYLMNLSDSKTSLVGLLLAVAVLWGARWGFVQRQPKRLLGLIVVMAAVGFALETSFDLRDTLLGAIGRDPSLTNRTDLWALLMPFSTSPMLGSGFMSFWAGDRMEQIWALLGGGVLQAHSGYIEQYLNLGYVGVAFTGLMLLKGMLDAHAQAAAEPGFSALRMAIIVAAIAYNYTEAAFYGVNNMWLLLLFSLLNAPPTATVAAAEDAIQAQRPHPVDSQGVQDVSTHTR